MTEFRHILNNFLVRDNTSKTDVAEYCEVAPSAVSQWANGSANPTVPNLIKLSEFFKVSINYLLGLTLDDNLSEKQTEIMHGMLFLSDSQMAMFYNFYQFVVSLSKR